jgi:hypothetical protein
MLLMIFFYHNKLPLSRIFYSLWKINLFLLKILKKMAIFFFYFRFFGLKEIALGLATAKNDFKGMKLRPAYCEAVSRSEILKRLNCSSLPVRQAGARL